MDYMDVRWETIEEAIEEYRQYGGYEDREEV